MSLRKSLLAGTCAVLSLIASTQPVRAREGRAGRTKPSSPEQAVEFLVAASRAGDLPACLDQIAPPFHDLMLMFILEEEADDILQAALDEKFGKKQQVGFRMEVKQDLLRIRKVKILSKVVESDTRVKLMVRETVKSFQREGDDLVEVPYLAIKDADGWRVLRPFIVLFFGGSEVGVTQKVEKVKDPRGKDLILFKMTFTRELDELGRQVQQGYEGKRKKTIPEVIADLRRTKAVAENVATEVKGGKYPTREAADDAFQRAILQTSKDVR